MAINDWPIHISYIVINDAPVHCFAIICVHSHMNVPHNVLRDH